MAVELRGVVLEALGEVAPEADPASLDPTVAFRDQIEIDSLDFLNFVLRLEERLGIHIPEADYPKLSSLEGCVRTLEAALACADRPAAGSDGGSRRRGRSR